jgi:hypothetical protein
MSVHTFPHTVIQADLNNISKSDKEQLPLLQMKNNKKQSEGEFGAGIP